MRSSNMALDDELANYIGSLNRNQKKILLGIMRSLFRSNESEQKIDLKIYNKEIDDAMKRIEAGHFTSLQDVEKEMESW